MPGKPGDRRVGQAALGAEVEVAQPLHAPQMRDAGIGGRRQEQAPDRAHQLVPSQGTEQRVRRCRQWRDLGQNRACRRTDAVEQAAIVDDQALGDRGQHREGAAGLGRVEPGRAGEGGGEDSASAIAVDDDNNVYTAGVGDDLFGENTAFTVLSFEPDTGGLRWVYYASASYVDEATDVAVADDSTVLASGVLWSGSSRSSYVVAAVNSGDGSERWRNSIARGDDDSAPGRISLKNSTSGMRYGLFRASTGRTSPTVCG